MYMQITTETDQWWHSLETTNSLLSISTLKQIQADNSVGRYLSNNSNTNSNTNSTNITTATNVITWEFAILNWFHRLWHVKHPILSEKLSQLKST